MTPTATTATATTLHVRLDATANAMLEELTAHYAKAAAALGLTYSRSDTVRVILRAAHDDMRAELAAAEEHASETPLHELAAIVNDACHAPVNPRKECT